MYRWLLLLNNYHPLPPIHPLLPASAGSGPIPWPVSYIGKPLSLFCHKCYQFVWELGCYMESPTPQREPDPIILVNIQPETAFSFAFWPPFSMLRFILYHIPFVKKRKPVFIKKIYLIFFLLSSFTKCDTFSKCCSGNFILLGWIM